MLDLYAHFLSKKSLQYSEVGRVTEETRGPSPFACVQTAPLIVSGLRHPATNPYVYNHTHTRTHVHTHVHISVCLYLHGGWK